MELSYEYLLERLELLRIAALPEQPAKVAAPPATAAPRQQPERHAEEDGQAPGQNRAGGAAGRRGAKAGGDSEAESGSTRSGEGADEYVEDSWLVEGDEEADGGSGSADAEMADAEEDEDGYASAAEELPSDSEDGERRGSGRQRQRHEQGEPAERPHAWNAAGLLPGQTKVLVAPAHHTPQQPLAAAGAASEQPLEQQQQLLQPEPQPASTEPLPAATEQLPATQVVAGGEAAEIAAAAADDATSPSTEPDVEAAGAQQSPEPSAGAVDAAMARAGSVMGGSSATEPGLLPPAPDVLQATAISPAEQGAGAEGQAPQANGAAASAADEEEEEEEEEVEEEEEEEQTEAMSEDEAVTPGLVSLLLACFGLLSCRP